MAVGTEPPDPLAPLLELTREMARELSAWRLHIAPPVGAPPDQAQVEEFAREHVPKFNALASEFLTLITNPAVARLRNAHGTAIVKVAGQPSTCYAGAVGELFQRFCIHLPVPFRSPTRDPWLGDDSSAVAAAVMLARETGTMRWMDGIDFIELDRRLQREFIAAKTGDIPHDR